MSLPGEFKELFAKENAVDMAVGLILGVGFTPVVNSSVNDILMLLIGS